MRRLWILVLAVGLLAAGCGRQGRFVPELEAVELVLFDRPDSALSLLAALDSASFRSDNDRAAYHLFLNMAHDKCYIDVSADTMIAFSADYFHQTGQPYYEMLANCYYSRVKFEQGEYAKSVILAMKARELAARLGNSFYEGLANRNIRDAYIANYYYKDGLNYSIESYRKFCESGVQPYINNALFDVASNLIALKRIDESFSWIYQARDSGIACSDSLLIIECDRLLAKAYFAKGNNDNAAALYREILKTGQAIRSDSIYLANTYIRQGRLDLAKSLTFSSASEVDYMESWVRWRYYEKEGDIDSLVVALRKCLNNTLDVTDQQTENEMPGVISDYTFMEQQMNQERAKVAHLQNMITIIVIVIVFVSIVIIAGVVIVRHRRKLEKNVAFALQMQDELSRLTQSHDEYNNKVQGLLSTRYNLLDQLSQIVYESTTSAAAKRRISETITELISELGREDSQKNQELAAFVDEAFGNLYSQFRADYPDLRQGEYNLFVYSVLGFAASTISVFLGEKSVTSVYERKRRLRNKIKATPSPRQEEYLAYLGQRAVN